MKLKLNLLWIAGLHILNIIMVIQIHYSLYMVNNILTNAKYFKFKIFNFQESNAQKKHQNEVFLVDALGTFRSFSI